MSGKKINILLSVQAKIIFITILIITIILGAYAVYDINRRQALVDKDLNELAKVTAQKLESNLRIPLWNLDSDLVSDTVIAEMLTKDISAILVFDSNGYDLVSGRQRSSNWDVLEASRNYKPVKDSDDLRREALITYKNQTIGKVIVYVSKSFKKKELKSSMLGLVLTLLLLDVTILLVLWVVMTNILRKPITLLSDAATQISRGDFNVNIDSNRNDEIGVVAASIERMKVSLNMAIQRLRRIEQRKKEAMRSVVGGSDD